MATVDYDIKFTDSDVNRQFDESNPNWRSNRQFNKMFIDAQEQYMNHRLKRDGFVFLNDVYDALGFPRTALGQILGWVVNAEPSFVDFRAEVVGANIYTLRFNVVVGILQHIEEVS